MARIALLLLSLIVAGGAWAQLKDPPGPGAKPVAKASKKTSSTRPAWAELPADQQQILAPLKPDWDSLEPERKKKWTGIAKRYPKMKPEQQARVQRRMQDWAKLTPEQRKQARENYRAIAKAKRERRDQDLRQHWAEYQSLSPSERERLVHEPVKPAPRKKKP
jgi:hypothetical protein